VEKRVEGKEEGREERETYRPWTMTVGMCRIFSTFLRKWREEGREGGRESEGNERSSEKERTIAKI